MLPRNPAKIFRSRWSALFWSAGVLFTAVTTIGFGNSDSHAKAGNQAEETLTDATGSEVSNADLAVLRNFIGN